jgi:hypothetical protein
MKSNYARLFFIPGDFLFIHVAFPQEQRIPYDCCNTDHRNLQEGVANTWN